MWSILTLHNASYIDVSIEHDPYSHYINSSDIDVWNVIHTHSISMLHIDVSIESDPYSHCINSSDIDVSIESDGLSHYTN